MKCWGAGPGLQPQNAYRVTPPPLPLQTTDAKQGERVTNSDPHFSWVIPADRMSGQSPGTRLEPSVSWGRSSRGACHCEERNDEAIPIFSEHEIASLRSQ